MEEPESLSVKNLEHSFLTAKTIRTNRKSRSIAEKRARCEHGDKKMNCNHNIAFETRDELSVDGMIAVEHSRDVNHEGEDIIVVKSKMEALPCFPFPHSLFSASLAEIQLKKRKMKKKKKVSTLLERQKDRNNASTMTSL